MTPIEIKKRLLHELEKARFGQSTRNLCNLIFMETHEKHIVIPGDHRMKQIYGYLKTMQKQGKVSNPYPGYWKLAASNHK